MDDYDEDFDGMEDELDEDERDDFYDFDDEDDEDLEPTDEDLANIESAGFDDGYADGIYDAGAYQGFGLSLDDEDDLSDEARDAYESGYLSGLATGDSQRED